MDVFNNHFTNTPGNLSWCSQKPRWHKPAVACQDKVPSCVWNRNWPVCLGAPSWKCCWCGSLANATPCCQWVSHPYKESDWKLLTVGLRGLCQNCSLLPWWLDPNKTLFIKPSSGPNKSQRWKLMGVLLLTATSKGEDLVAVFSVPSPGLGSAPPFPARGLSLFSGWCLDSQKLT